MPTLLTARSSQFGPGLSTWVFDGVFDPRRAFGFLLMVVARLRAGIVPEPVALWIGRQLVRSSGEIAVSSVQNGFDLRADTQPEDIA
jgi:hypothetical protein